MQAHACMAMFQLTLKRHFSLSYMGLLYLTTHSQSISVIGPCFCQLKKVHELKSQCCEIKVDS